MTTSQADLMRQLHDEHAPALWGYCVRLTNGDRPRAQDIVQETLLRAHRERKQVRDPRAWCFTVALNLLRSHFRRQRWLPLRAAESVEGWEFVERHATRDAVHRALAAVRPDQRTALLLQTIAGFTHAEIAAMHGVSVEAARQRVHRAREAFARAYAIREVE